MGALSCDKYEVLYKTVFIDSALMGLVGTASRSNFPVVYVITDVHAIIIISLEEIVSDF